MHEYERRQRRRRISLFNVLRVGGQRPADRTQIMINVIVKLSKIPIYTCNLQRTNDDMALGCMKTKGRISNERKFLTTFCRIRSFEYGLDDERAAE